jgi:hypothetical protein
VSFNAVRDETDPAKLQIFVRVMNFGPKLVKVPVQIETYSGGQLQKVYPAQTAAVPARQVIRGDKSNPESPQEKDQPGEVGLTFDISDFDDRNEMIIRGRLPDHKDAFALDDEAWLVVGVVRKAKVLIVGRSNPILEAFFTDDATKEVALVTTISCATARLTWNRLGAANTTWLFSIGARRLAKTRCRGRTRSSSVDRRRRGRSRTPMRNPIAKLKRSRRRL